MVEDSPAVVFCHEGYTVRHWSPVDRSDVSQVVKQCLEAYGLEFEPKGTDLDAIEVEEHYMKNKGEFWVITDDNTNKIVGTGGYYEVKCNDDVGVSDCARKSSAVEIRKMYLLPQARGKKLGRNLLQVIISCDNKLYINYCHLHFVSLYCRSWRRG